MRPLYNLEQARRMSVISGSRVGIREGKKRRARELRVRVSWLVRMASRRNGVLEVHTSVESCMSNIVDIYLYRINVFFLRLYEENRRVRSFISQLESFSRIMQERFIINPFCPYLTQVTRCTASVLRYPADDCGKRSAWRNVAFQLVHPRTASAILTATRQS